MSTQIKNTLFRFVTMRAPELLEKDAVNKSFVKHPELDGINERFTSAYLSNMQTAITDKRTVLKSTSTTFLETAVVKKEELVENELISQEMYDFSIWLTKNRNRFTIAEMNAKISEGEDLLDGLDQATLVLLWDNLFYQIVKSKSSYIRDIILSILVADFFLKNYPTVAVDDLDQLRKLAQARVIMPKELFEKEGVSNKDGLKKQALLDLPITTKNLDKEVSTIISNQKIEMLKKVAEELKSVKAKYLKANQKAYQSAFDSYQTEVQDAYVTADTREKTYINPETNQEETYTEYVNLVLPVFEYIKMDELNMDFIASNVSQQAYSTIENILAIHEFETFDEINAFIQNEITSGTETIFDNTNVNQTLVSTNGIIVPVSNINSDTINAFTISGVGLGYVPEMPLQLLFNQIPNVSDVVSASYTIEGGSKDINSPSFSGTSFQSAVINEKLSVTIFTEKFNITQITSSIISGEFVLTNGNKILFSGTINSSIPNLGSIGFYTIKGKGTFEVDLLDNSIGIVDGNIGNVVDYIPSGFGISRLGVVDYRKVEQEVCCYVPGEVSHIENVMAREYKEKTTRRLRRTEDTTTLTNEQEIEKLTDTSSTDRFEMNQEVSSLLAEDTHQGSFVNSGYSNNKIGFSMNAGADFATNTTTEESNSQAVSQAKEITERALDRVVKKIKEERVSKIIEEFSEENTHGFDNRKGDNHVSGVYRWVDKVYKNKIVNYGKRLMYEFMIPEPASFHNLVTNETEEYETILEKPLDPRNGDFSVALKLNDGFESKYLKWVEKFNIEIDEKPKEFITIGKSFSQNKNDRSTGFSHSEMDSITIPDGYESVEVSVFLHGGNSFGQANGLGIGSHLISGGEIYIGAQRFDNRLNQPAVGYRGSFPVSYTAMALHTSSGTVELKCQLTEEAKQKWRLTTFNAIIKAYEEKLAEYNESLATLKLAQTEKTKTNPAFYRQIENTILRKNCIEYLISQEALGKDFILKSSNLQEMRVDYNSPDLETYAAKVKFFEQAFEWNIMSYYFYPFYWAKKDNWKTLYNINDVDDPTFKAFLQSGMARVILTVRPGFEEAVNWYMATGQVWNGGQVPTMDDELFVSIIEELRNPEGEVEETWESRVPTSLTLIQAGSIGLEVTGLPCNTECGDHLLFDSDMNPIVQTNTTIGDTATTTETPSGEEPPADA